ncbi:MULTISPECIES: hypothetical protein [unclassified Thioalkalivibrio]|uniref:hypothetical protein n=1 Tax=unclassified Thioalkalivibrio TaxID=2621013 RepID=UPI0003774B40|nr:MULTISPECIES: hypothetical protein [unclassified Thioalkalivibrio]
MVDELQHDRSVRPLYPVLRPPRDVRPVHTSVAGHALSDDHDRDPILRPGIPPAQQKPPRLAERERRRGGRIAEYA